MKQFFILFLVFSPSLAINFRCKFEDIEVYKDKYYGCSVFKFKTFHCPTHMVGYEGEHQSGKTDDQVLAVECGIACFQLETIPRGIVEFFPNLIALKLRHTAIKTLDGSELVGYPKLQYFQLSNCDFLQEVPGNLFTPTPELVFVDLSWNKKLSSLGDKLLNSLENLTSAFFFNSCVNLNAETPEKIEELKAAIQESCEEPTSNDVEKSVKTLMEKNEKMETKIDEIADLISQKLN